MTRHNLDQHISWLLSTKVTPPVGVQTPISKNLTAAADIVPEDIWEEELENKTTRNSLGLAQTHQLSQKVNVTHEFVRPELPSSNISRLQPQGTSRTQAEGDLMGKPSSVSRSTRPRLLSEYQLATPASTANSTASSSLADTYASFLRETKNSWFSYKSLGCTVS